MRGHEGVARAGDPALAHGLRGQGQGGRAALRLDDPAQIAQSHRMRAALGLSGGQLVANPIPLEAEIPRSEIDPVIHAALAAAAREKVSAKEVTPFLLARIFEATEGRSLAANIALVLNNARLAAQIAAALG